MPEKILIIKHGALGDWILSTGAFKLIRQHHPNAHIVLLTAAAYVPLAEKTTWFNEIWVDNRKGAFESFAVIRKMRKAKFAYVYDMQRSQRTHFYYRALKTSKLYWSGNIRGRSGYFIDDLNKHIVQRIALQLQASHILTFPHPDIFWLQSDIKHIKPHGPYALIIPGCAKHRPKKRWTADGYLKVIEYLHAKKIQSVLIGTEADREIINAIVRQLETLPIINLINQTSFAELAELARHAQFSLGSDTGSMHIAAATGTPSLSLFCLSESNPVLNKPWGTNTSVITTDDLATLDCTKVITAIDDLVKH